MPTAQMGAQAKLGTHATTGTDANEPFVFVSEGVQKRGVILERDGIRGTRTHMTLDTRTGPHSVGGPLVLEPTPEDLAKWFPRILGAVATGGPPAQTYSLAETIPDFSLQVDRLSKVFRYDGVKVSRAVFTGSAGGLLRLSLDLVGKTETVTAAGTFPALTLTYTQPYIFADCVFTLAASAREVADFTLTIDNDLVADRFVNTLTLSDIPTRDRVITLSVTVPYTTTNADLYAQALAGAAGTLVIANGIYSTTFTFGLLQIPPESPVVGSRDEIMLGLNMVARSASTAGGELTVTHDITA